MDNPSLMMKYIMYENGIATGEGERSAQHTPPRKSIVSSSAAPMDACSDTKENATRILASILIARCPWSPETIPRCRSMIISQKDLLRQASRYKLGNEEPEGGESNKCRYYPRQPEEVSLQ